MIFTPADELTPFEMLPAAPLEPFELTPFEMVPYEPAGPD